MQLQGSGALWAGVGKTALDAVNQFGTTLMNSPLNPMVKAQMDAKIKSAREGIAQANWLDNLPGGIGRILYGYDANGNAVAKPAADISDPTMAGVFQQALSVVPKQGEGSQAGQPPETAPRTGTEPDQTKQPQPAQPAQPQPKQPPTPEEMGKGKVSTVAQPSNMFAAAGAPPPGPDQFQGPTQAQTNQAIQQALQRNQFASSQPGIPAGYQPPTAPSGPQGAPPGTFLNPATGSYEPMQQGPPPAQQPDQAAQQAQRQQQLAQWQATNAQPVASAEDALQWARRYHTGYKTATYLPSGGPGGEPAYNFSDGKSSNMVPISQMVKNGFGPSVVMQNTSSVLGTVEQAQQAQQGPQGPGLPLGPMAPAQPPQPQAQAAQPTAPQPPAAPGAQPPQAQPPAPQPSAQYPTVAQDQTAPGQPPAAPGMRDIYGNPLSAYTAVASKGGPSLEQLSAQTGQLSGVRPTDVPQEQRKPGDPLNRLADETLKPEEQQAIIQQAQDQIAKEPLTGYGGDKLVKGTKGPYHYYINDDPNSQSRGRVYTALPGSSGGYFNIRKWYLGTNDYTEEKLPDSDMRQIMQEKWVNTGHLSPAELAAMKTPEEMQPWLQRAWQNDNYQRSSPVEGINSDLDAAERIHKSVVQIDDIEHTLADAGYPNLNSAQLAAAKGGTAITALGASPPDVVSSAAMRRLGQLLNRVDVELKEHPKLQLEPGSGGGMTTPPVHLGALLGPGITIPSMGVPDSSALSDSVASGEPIETRSRRLHEYLNAVDDRYKDLVDQANTQWYRISPKHDANTLRIGQNLPIADRENSYTQHLHTIDTDGQYNDFAAAHHNTPFIDGRTGKKKWTQ
jgi:hypothetical protein